MVVHRFREVAPPCTTHVTFTLLDMNLHRAVQNNIHRLARLFDRHHVHPRRKDPPMRVLRHPIQLGVRQPLEQFNVREDVAGIVFLEFSHSQHILLPSQRLPKSGFVFAMGESFKRLRKSVFNLISNPSHAARESGNNF